MAFSYEYPRPAVTVDAVLFTLVEDKLQLLLIERCHPPHRGCWALPGGFVDEHESLETAARRELREECGLEVGPMEQIGAYGDPGRDPRGHTIGVAFLCALPHAELLAGLAAGDDAADARLIDLRALPELAFDHGRMIADTLTRVASERRARALLSGVLGPRALVLLEAAQHEKRPNARALGLLLFYRFVAADQAFDSSQSGP